jgi:hypothetical protein
VRQARQTEAIGEQQRFEAEAERQRRVAKRRHSLESDEPGELSDPYGSDTEHADGTADAFSHTPPIVSVNIVRPKAARPKPAGAGRAARGAATASEAGEAADGSMLTDRRPKRLTKPVMRMADLEDDASIRKVRLASLNEASRRTSTRERKANSFTGDFVSTEDLDEMTFNATLPPQHLPQQRGQRHRQLPRKDSQPRSCNQDGGLAALFASLGSTRPGDAEQDDSSSDGSIASVHEVHEALVPVGTQTRPREASVALDHLANPKKGPKAAGPTAQHAPSPLRMKVGNGFAIGNQLGTADWRVFPQSPHDSMADTMMPQRQAPAIHLQPRMTGQQGLGQVAFGAFDLTRAWSEYGAGALERPADGGVFAMDTHRLPPAHVSPCIETEVGTGSALSHGPVDLRGPQTSHATDKAGCMSMSRVSPRQSRCEPALPHSPPPPPPPPLSCLLLQSFRRRPRSENLCSASPPPPSPVDRSSPVPLRSFGMSEVHESGAYPLPPTTTHTNTHARARARQCVHRQSARRTQQLDPSSLCRQAGPVNALPTQRPRSTTSTLDNVRPVQLPLSTTYTCRCADRSNLPQPQEHRFFEPALHGHLIQVPDHLSTGDLCDGLEPFGLRPNDAYTPEDLDRRSLPPVAAANDSLRVDADCSEDGSQPAVLQTDGRLDRDAGLTEI